MTKTGHPQVRRSLNCYFGYVRFKQPMNLSNFRIGGIHPAEAALPG